MVDNMITMDDCVFELDGDAWCCHLPNFTNMMECPVGFGDTQEAAFQDFLDSWGDTTC
jgi:hypothetical protein